MIEHEELNKMSFEDIWNYFKRNKDEFKNGDVEKVYRKARNGVNINFDLSIYFNYGYTPTATKYYKRIIKSYPPEDIESELEERERLVYQIILSNIGDVKSYESRI